MTYGFIRQFDTGSRRMRGQRAAGAGPQNYLACETFVRLLSQRLVRFFRDSYAVGSRADA